MFQSTCKPGHYFLTTSILKELYGFYFSSGFFDSCCGLGIFFCCKISDKCPTLLKKFRTLKIFSARFMNERFYKSTKSNVTNYCISQKHFQKFILAQYSTTSLKISKAANCFRFLLKSQGSPNHEACARYRSSHNRSERLGIVCRAARIIN